jgi:hypothetical protein
MNMDSGEIKRVERCEGCGLVMLPGVQKVYVTTLPGVYCCKCAETTSWGKRAYTREEILHGDGTDAPELPSTPMPRQPNVRPENMRWVWDDPVKALGHWEPLPRVGTDEWLLDSKVKLDPKQPAHDSPDKRSLNPKNVHVLNVPSKLQGEQLDGQIVDEVTPMKNVHQMDEYMLVNRRGTEGYVSPTGEVRPEEINEAAFDMAREDLRRVIPGEVEDDPGYREQIAAEALGVDDEEEDVVNSPSHYNATGVETIDIIREALGDEEFLIGCRWNVLKYAIRAPYKGYHNQDMAKAAWYARMAAGDDPRDDVKE